MFRLAIFVGLATIAFFADRYLEKNPLKIVQTSDQHPSPESGAAYIYYNPQSNLTAKPVVLKAPTRFVQSALHDKFLQKHHQLRNFFALKADDLNHKPPVQVAFYILRREYPSGSPDDPFLS